MLKWPTVFQFCTASAQPPPETIRNPRQIVDQIVTTVNEAMALFQFCTASARPTPEKIRNPRQIGDQIVTTRLGVVVKQPPTQFLDLTGEGYECRYEFLRVEFLGAEKQLGWRRDIVDQCQPL